MSIFAGVWKNKDGGAFVVTDFLNDVLVAWVSSTVIGQYSVPPEIGDMTAEFMPVRGSFKTYSNSTEDFYLARFSGSGSARANTDGEVYPAALTFACVIQGDTSNLLTTQYASSFEFPGNAEGISGDVITWERDPTQKGFEVCDAPWFFSPLREKT